jgi:hypothetical protein
VEHPWYWCGGSQSFGPGDHILEFYGVPDFSQTYELKVGVSPDQGVAAGCQHWQTEQVKKFWNYNVPKKCVYIHYDCMQSYDIRYGNDLESRLDDAFGEGPAYNDMTLCLDNTSIQNKLFGSEQEFLEWVQIHWREAYYQNPEAWDCYLAGVNDFFPRLHWYLNGDSFPDSACGYTKPLPGHTLGERGCASVILVGWMTLNVFESDRKEAILRTSTHELGHSRAGLQHAYGWTIIFHEPSFDCVMDMLQFDHQDYLKAGWESFCDSCLIRIAGNSWP